MKNFISTLFLSLYIVLLYAQSDAEHYRPSVKKAISPAHYSAQSVFSKYKKQKALMADENTLLGLAASTSQALKREYYLNSDEGFLDAWKEDIQRDIRAYETFLDNKVDVSLALNMRPDANAFALGAGYISINVGLLAELESENELRLVLAHEIAHNYFNHIYEGVVTQKKSQDAVDVTNTFLGPIGALISVGAAKATIQKRSRQRESQADSLAIEMLLQQGVNPLSGAGIYRHFNFLEEKAKLTPKSKTFFLFGSSHPGSLERIKEIEKIMKKQEFQEKALPYDDFKTKRQSARYEKINQRIKNYQYQDAIESGWKYLSETPNDDRLKALILEALRRHKLYVGEEDFQKSVLFDTYKLKSYESMPFERQALSKTEKELINILFANTTTAESSYFDFKITYQKMYEQLLPEVQKAPSTEALLTLALHGDEPNKEMLRRYVEQKGTYTLYAKYLLGEIDVASDENTAMLMVPYLSTRRQKSLGSYTYTWVSEEQIREEYDFSELGSPKKYPYANEVYYFKDYEKLTLRDLRELSSIYAFGYVMAQSKNPELNYATLTPEFMEFFLRNKIHRVHFFTSSGTHTKSGNHEVVMIDIAEKPKFFAQSKNKSTYMIGGIPKNCNKLIKKGHKKLN